MNHVQFLIAIEKVLCRCNMTILSIAYVTVLLGLTGFISAYTVAGVNLSGATVGSVLLGAYMLIGERRNRLQFKSR